MTPRWHITPGAAQAYHAALRQLAGRGDGTVEHIERWTLEDLRARLADLAPLAALRATDAHGRELYRSPRSRERGNALRWVVDPRVPAGDLPRVIWVGFRAPPRPVWEAPYGDR